MTSGLTTSALLISLFAAGPLFAQEGSAPPEAEPQATQEKTPPVQGQEKPAPKPAPKSVQEKEKDEKEKELREINPFEAEKPAQAEMEELFLKVERRLQRVTKLLYEASSGDTSAADDVGASGIDELIRDAESEASAAQSDIAKILQATRLQGKAASTEIDRILELAAQNPGSGSGGPPNSKPQPGQGTPQQGQTPSGSRREDKGEGAPEPGQEPGDKPGEEPNGEKDGEGEKEGEGETPKGNQEAMGGKDGEGKDQPKSELGGPKDANGEGQWGDLPIHLRKVFQNGVSDDVPPRYRDWVDAYYKRLGKGSGR